eukprot:TRINITY_DN15113_c0_g1_i1.p1 TRINITY_DN15113_c0_g1~~TRINITY_DN15113_c0_g1_i1.p1  ORF type:complete len:167 (-),score=8.41 TRINITY_DN15113_c0_g1_i1:49-549(-)
MKRSGERTSFFLVLMKWYCILHVFISLFCDAQAIAPASWYPHQVRSVVHDWYVPLFKDPFMSTPTPWFQSLIWAEMTVQSAYIIAGIYAFSTHKNWIRMPSILYGVHVATTMLPIFGEIFFGKNRLLTWGDKAQIAALYSPYFFIPLYLVYFMIQHERPFPHAKKA